METLIVVAKLPNSSSQKEKSVTLITALLVGENMLQHYPAEPNHVCSTVSVPQ